MNESQQGALAVIGIIITIIVAAVLTVHILTPTEIQQEEVANQNETIQKVGGGQTVETNPFNNETNNTTTATTADNNSIVIDDLNLNVSNATGLGV